ncbi:hypothetical protein [Desertivirga brevis]|uniref:hypothetical protein n=1 Tax=Desertivirga brevis TaxID=2810310 RepID=UPI001A974117|nr:hypothetical protein [Pedobacter sp. SYSU D00873]
MYSSLLSLHSLFRWLVVISLIFSILFSYFGLVNNKPFSKSVNTIRHWTATIAHLQLMIGLTLYFQSPLIKLQISDSGDGLISEQYFFRYLHLLLMLIAITVITIGSAKAKRANTDKAKHRIMLSWFGAGLLLIVTAIPWPFSPLAKRPVLRDFAVETSTVNNTITKNNV